jgi:hypothetical protein
MHPAHGLVELVVFGEVEVDPPLVGLAPPVAACRDLARD